MSNIKDIQVLNEKAIAVKDPNVLVNKRALITIPEAGLSWLHYLDEYDNDVAQPVEINGTSWTILGMSDDIGVEDILKIIHPAKKLFGGYFYDYVKKAHVSVTPKNSFASLLKSKGIEVPHLILVKNG